MLEPKGTIAEVWVVGADEAGISLLSGGDAWRSPGVIRSGHRSYDEAKWLVRDVDDVAVLHSTSWRDDTDVFVHTYVAVARLDDLAETVWPDAQPITLRLLEHVGKPTRVGAADEPQPTYIHVLEHSLRHLAFLSEHDAAVQAALDEHWRRHLEPLEPALAKMYLAA